MGKPFELFGPDWRTIETFFIGADRFLNTVNNFQDSTANTNYPPYNLRNVGEDKFELSLALAGWKKDEIEIQLDKHPNRVLIISGVKKGEGEKEDFIHKGIGRRAFQRQFSLMDDIEVESCRFEDGMLYVDLERVIPKEKKPETFNIK